ncbi:MAG: BLUF domain-containing protein [Pirellulaceae bacterium]|nr:BLUF domain-containing protein [Pirellulaceae bacterium]
MSSATNTLPRPAASLPVRLDDTPQSLYQLVYVSSATTPFSPADLAALLERSRRKNSLAGLSGILLYHDGNFMQLLEGEAHTVQVVYARITQDPRHHGCLILIKGQVAERTFPDWTMGFRDFASAEVKAMPGYNDFLEHNARGDTFPTDPNRALTLLRTFRSRLH